MWWLEIKLVGIKCWMSKWKEKKLMEKKKKSERRQDGEGK
jgi:hypothetical protein